MSFETVFCPSRRHSAEIRGTRDARRLLDAYRNYGCSACHRERQADESRALANMDDEPGPELATPPASDRAHQRWTDRASERPRPVGA